MPASSPVKKSSRDKVRAYRARLRRNGLKPVQFWLPDIRSRRFRLEAHRQSMAVAHSHHARDDQAFIDAIASEVDD